MNARARTPRPSAALRLARQAWHLLHVDSARAIALADQALAAARARHDVAGEGWARLARGFHLLYFARPRVAAPELKAAQHLFDAQGDRAGAILAGTGLARGLWREGRYDASLALVLALRDEGMAVLRDEQRGLLLNTVAGCYSARNQSEQAFAYMYQALRDAPPARGHGYDAVLHCNLAHELLQLGDYHEALKHVEAGLARFDVAKNPRLASVLFINRVICLTDLDRAAEALPDIARVMAIPADASGRGALTPHFETLAIAALRAGDVALGRELVARARGVEREAILEEAIEQAIAEALLSAADGRAADAAATLAAAHGRVAASDTTGLTLRVRCMLAQAQSQALDALGDAAGALAALRQWQQLTQERQQLASRAHYQAAALQTELLALQHKLDEKDAQRRATERARAELEVVNRTLEQKIEEVQALQTALRQQATRDELTGLFNRRYLNDALPALWALAQRDGKPLAAVILDLDHFKRVNDERGHDAGDRLLAAFGRLLAANLRKSDIACRYGGEEFCVLMPETDAAGARRKIAALLKRWRVESLLQGAVGEAGTSFSAGVADSLVVGASSQALLKTADDELLAAKRGGRAQVRLFSPPTSPAA
ncbi:MAG TPA: GGDEF domain-containing protein [Burkholderiaceae bacterium]|nr:GGDEF domain-containing protein [Burkholderiaceae bacterium]